MLATRVYAEDAKPETAVTPASTETAEPAPAASAVQEVAVVSPGNVTIDFKDADIQNVLRILAFKSGVNIVAGKDVTGTVTMRLVDVPWEKALDVILKTYGYAYDKQENVIRVSTVENLNKEALSTEVFVLNYSKATDVEKSVKTMATERGSVRSDSRSNTLIVTDMPTVLQTIRTVVQRLDQATPQVLINAKVVELTLGSTDRLGIDWNMHVSAKGTMRPTTFPFQAVQRGALYRYYPIGRGSQTGGISAGGVATTTNIEDFPKGKGGIAADNIQPTFPVADKTDFTFGTMDFTDFKVALEAIKLREDAKILSEPHVTVLNNQEAKVLVGQVIGIPKFERNNTTGKMEITGYDSKDLGVRLTVVPQVNSADEIVVTVHPEITSLAGFEALTEDIKAPLFDTREAQTNVRVKSGQTIVIGGLIKEDTKDTVNKVPLLGDLPILDKFFSHRSKETVKTDLLFFMTVTVLRDRVPESHKL